MQVAGNEWVAAPEAPHEAEATEATEAHEATERLRVGPLMRTLLYTTTTVNPHNNKAASTAVVPWPTDGARDKSLCELTIVQPGGSTGSTACSTTGYGSDSQASAGQAQAQAQAQEAGLELWLHVRAVEPVQSVATHQSVAKPQPTARSGGTHQLLP